MKPRVTVVVPAYNASASVVKALASLKAQKMADWEAVVVDDGSTDDTAEIVRREAEADKRIRLVAHGSNRGLAAASNTGVAKARSEWVTRLDADDSLPPTALADMLDAALAAGADIAWGARCGAQLTPPPEAIASGRVNLNDLPFGVDTFSMWGKMMKRAILLRNPCWEGYDRWEDLGCVSRVLASSPKVAFVTQRPVYNYYVAPRGHSLSTANQQRVLSDHLEIARRLDVWFAGEGLSESFAEFLLHLKFFAKVKLLRCRPRRPRLWRSTFPEVNRHIMSLRHVALRYRLLFALFAIGQRH